MPCAPTAPAPAVAAPPPGSLLAYEEDADPRAKQKLEYVLQFCTQLLAELTDTILEEPSQLETLSERIGRELSRKYHFHMSKGETNKWYMQLVRTKQLAPSFIIDSITKNKSVRSRSGVLPISIATDGVNFSCAFDCAFCPNETVAAGAPRDMARSYLSSEGTFIRGAAENFLPAGQTWRRLLELELMGHPPDKVEMIVLGGTWDSYAPEYREEFIRQVFYACNVFHRFSLRLDGDLTPLTREWAALNPFKHGMSFDPEGHITSKLRPPRSLAEEKAENQESPCARLIGILLETRPDCISKPSLLQLRALGCTRVQLGVQHTDNAILKFNNRGHGVEKSVSAIMFARDNCFKVDGHLMPDLPSTTVEKDFEMIEKVFGGEELQLDYCKLYPCLDLPYTLSRTWKETGVWKPIAEHDFPAFLDLLRHAMAVVPPWVRVNRVQRDFPEATAKNLGLGFVSEHIKSNLQQMVMQALKKNGQGCYDVRSREIKNQFPSDCNSRARLFIRCYRANHGTELFISVELPGKGATHQDDAILMGLLRLRVTDVDAARLGGEKNTRVPSHLLPEFAARPVARIRELHVYGNLRMVNPNKHGAEAASKLSQHTGVGKFLMAVAEHVSHGLGFGSIAVISGVGVRSYYAKLGYALDGNAGEYMFKPIALPDQLLPLTLFGETHPSQSVGDALTALQLAQQHLPQWSVRGANAPPAHATTRLPRWLAGAAAWCGGGNSEAAPPWFRVYPYPHIQQGRAELVVADLSLRRAQRQRQARWGPGAWPAYTSSVAVMGVQALVLVACGVRQAAR